MTRRYWSSILVSKLVSGSGYDLHLFSSPVGCVDYLSPGGKNTAMDWCDTNVKMVCRSHGIPFFSVNRVEWEVYAVPVEGELEQLVEAHTDATSKSLVDIMYRGCLKWVFSPTIETIAPLTLNAQKTAFGYQGYVDISKRSLPAFHIVLNYNPSFEHVRGLVRVHLVGEDHES